VKLPFVYKCRNCDHEWMTTAVGIHNIGLNMFVLAEMKHVIRTPPHIFHLKLNDAIAEELNKKLANKVPHKHRPISNIYRSDRFRS
jgi:hypothetical protein